MEHLRFLEDWLKPRFKFGWWLLTWLTISTLVVAGGFDNLGFNGNTISSRNTNGNIIVDPNGTGQVRFNDLSASTFGYLDSNKDLVSKTATEATALLNAVVGDSGSGGTKGLVPAPSAGDAAAGKYLKADGVWTAPTASTLYTYRSVASTDSVVSGDYGVVLSGASFTLTLPTAVSVSGKVYEILHNGTTLTQKYTLNTTSGQTIGGVASGSYVLHTKSERLKIMSNGANWLILDHFTSTGWAEYTPTVTGCGTISTSRFVWRREGDNVIVNGYFTSGTTTADAASFTLPGGNSIDTAKLNRGNTTSSHGHIVGHYGMDVGDSGGYMVTATGTSAAVVYAADSIDTADVTQPTSGNQFTTATLLVAIQFEVPISGWQP
jgi:hypothetical protein